MLLSTKQLRKISILFQRGYCISKYPPPWANPDQAPRASWTPYDQVVNDRKNEFFVEDVMEFRHQDHGPFQRHKGGTNLWQNVLLFIRNRLIRSRPLKQRIELKVRDELIQDQTFNLERVKLLGPDLAAAHFICARGGGVKFVGKDGFIQPGVNKAHTVLPPYRDDAYKVEAINAVNYKILYQGLSHLRELESLRWISFKGNDEFDNWCVDKLSLVAPNLEFINLSGTKIDHNVFGCFYRFKRLKCVCVEDCYQTDLFKLACLTVESEYPDLVIIGLQLRTNKKSVFNC